MGRLVGDFLGGGLVGGFTGGLVGGLTGRVVLPTREEGIGFPAGFLPVFGAAVLGGLLCPGSGLGSGAGLDAGLGTAARPFDPCGFLVGFGTACLPPFAAGFGLAFVSVLSWRRMVLYRAELMSCACRGGSCGVCLAGCCGTDRIKCIREGATEVKVGCIGCGATHLGGRHRLLYGGACVDESAHKDESHLRSASEGN